MKFWVKAVVDNRVSEQLLVQAQSIDDVRDALTQALRIPIASLSITDFQNQVVDRLRGGVEIITVWVQSQSGADDTVPTHSDTPRRETRTSVGATARISPGPHSTPSLTPKSTFRDIDTSFRGEESFTSTVDAHSRSQPHVQPLMPRGSLRDRATPPRDDGLADGSSSSLFTTKEPMREPCVAKLCLRRDDVAAMLDEQFDSKYTADLLGCFVRAKEPDGYGFYQIADIVDGDAPLILLDTVYTSESRQLDTISNAAPTSGEIRAWFRKMLSEARQLPSFSMVEAKAGDIESDLRAVRAAMGIGSPTSSKGASLLATAVVGHNAAADGHAARPDVLEHELTQAAYDTPVPRTSRRMTQVGAALFPHVNFFHGKCVVRTNDRLRGCGAVIVTRRDATQDVSQFCLVAQRSSNTQSKKVLQTDSAMCVIELDPTGHVISDTDIASKGFHFRGAPCMWEHLAEPDRFLALAEPYGVHTAAVVPVVGNSPHSKHDTHGKPSLPLGGRASTPFTEDESGRLVQQFSILRGPMMDCLRWMGQATALLPLPMWAQNEGHDPRVLAPTLIVSEGKLHAFYLIRIQVDEPASSRYHSRPRVASSPGGKTTLSPGAARHLDAVALTPHRSRGSSAAGVSPQHRRHSSLLAQFEAVVARPFNKDEDTDGHPSADHGIGAELSSRPVSLNGSFTTNPAQAAPPAPVERAHKYALAHAHTMDATLQQWTVANNREPIVYAFDEEPLYTVFCVPSGATLRHGEGDANAHDAEDDGSVACRGEHKPSETLALAWWDSSCATMQTLSTDPTRFATGLASHVPLLCFAYHPTEVPAVDPYGRTRRGSAMDWTPVMITSTVPCNIVFEDAEAITITPAAIGSETTALLLTVIGRSRSRTPASTFHTPIWNTHVTLTGPPDYQAVLATAQEL